MVNWFNKMKHKLGTVNNIKKYICLFIVLSITMFVFFTYENTFYYEFYFNNKLIGVIEEKSLAENVLSEISINVLNEYGEDAHFKSETRFQKIIVSEDKLIKRDQLVKMLLDRINVYKAAGVVIVDGEERLVADTVQIAEKILQLIQMYYVEQIQQNSEYCELLRISFQQDVEIKSKDVLVDNILFQQEDFNEIIVNKEQLLIADKFTFINNKIISRAYNNEISSPQNPYIGEFLSEHNLNIVLERPVVDVIAKTKQTEKVEIDYKVQKNKDASLYSGESKVQQEGKKGEKEIIKMITYINGINQEEEVLQEIIVKEPITKVVLIGTKQRPASRRVAPTYSGDIGSSIVETAKHYIGVPYKQGGASPSGFDCSGFTQYVYSQYGIGIPRTTGGQGSTGGYVSRSNLKPGDLVIFKGHSGIFVGGSSFIHSPKPGKSVQISSLNVSYWSSNFISGRRVY